MCEPFINLINDRLLLTHYRGARNNPRLVFHLLYKGRLEKIFLSLHLELIWREVIAGRQWLIVHSSRTSASISSWLMPQLGLVGLFLPRDSRRTEESAFGVFAISMTLESRRCACDCWRFDNWNFDVLLMSDPLMSKCYPHKRIIDGQWVNVSTHKKYYPERRERGEHFNFQKWRNTHPLHPWRRLNVTLIGSETRIMNINGLIGDRYEGQWLISLFPAVSFQNDLRCNIQCCCPGKVHFSSQTTGFPRENDQQKIKLIDRPS